MRNLKKFLALVLATMMLLSVAVISTSAAKKDYDYSDAAERLAALQVMKGNENGDLMLDSEVTRYQAALFFVQALTGETETATWQTTKNSAYFSDVVDYGTAIDYAYGINIVKGRGNGIYGYNDAIIYQDMLVMAVRALGYETADMSYPYGYILAAQKLGLTENVEKTDYKAALTRGETAQIIWDMLDTKVAVIDPITDKILYPDETGLTDALINAAGIEVTTRETLMEQSDLAGDKIVAQVVEFIEADEDDEDDVDTVVIEFVYVEDETEVEVSVEIAASDIGVDAETPKVSYLGLPVDLYIDVDVADFDQDAYDDEDAAVVFAFAVDYESVLNLGDGNVKFVDANKDYFNFGGTKLSADKYVFSVAAFNDGAWDWEVVDIDTLASIFEYDDEYVNEEANTYGQISYRVTDVVTEDDYTVVEVLYTPLSFGQYNVRELKDRANSSELTDFATIATYTGEAYTNYDEETSVFEEVIVGSNAKVTANTTSVSAKNGEKAKALTLAGEEVEAGDFMFYAYNEVDNILTVAKNCGTFETGRLTAKNTSKETVKIGGTNYAFGFAGPANANGMPATWDAYAEDIQSDYIGELKAGKDNVKYLAVDDKIVYMTPCEEEHNDSIYDFAVISTDAEIIADLLDVSDTKYAKNLSGEVTEENNSSETYADFVTDGVYVDDNGYVAVAVLSKTTGEWELGYIKSVELDYVHEDEEFSASADVATLASYVDMFEDVAGYSKFDTYAAAMEVVESVLVAVVEEEDGVYTIADPAYVDVDGEDACFFVSGATEEGILFNDNNAKTNAITCDDEVDAERVTLDEESVIIVVDLVNGKAGARVGVQGYDNSYATTEGYFLAASADLIVLVDTAATEGESVVDAWNEASVSSSDETWYMVTVDTAVELENVSDDDDAAYVVTITNLIDLKTLETVESVTVEVDTADDELVTFVEDGGILLHKDGEEIGLEERTFEEIIVKVANANDKKLDYELVDVEGIVFDNEDTILVPELLTEDDGEDGMMTPGEAVDVEVKVVTLNWFEDAEDYDFDSAVLMATYDDAEEDPYDIGSTTIEIGEEEFEVWAYLLDGDMVEEITEPTEGIFDNYVVATNGAAVLVPEDGNDDYADSMVTGVGMYVVGAYADGVVYLTVYKVVAPIGVYSDIMG